MLMFLAVLTSPSRADDEPATRTPRSIEAYEPAEGHLRIGPEPERVIARTDVGYTLILPADAPARGTVLFLDGWRVGLPSPLVVEEGSFDYEALGRGLAILRVTTGNPLDFLFRDRDLQTLANRIQRARSEHGLTDVPVVAAGMSLGGTRVLRLAKFLADVDTSLELSAVAIVDAPLDMIRFHAAAVQAARRTFHPAAADEGRWVTYLLEENLGGPPSTHRDAYVAYSPFVYGEPEGGNASILAEVPIRAYHEPDVDWWIQNRRKGYYGMNSLDLAELINVLHLQGNERAELITTVASRDGYDEGRSPHSWSIVDEPELAAWFAAQIEMAAGQ